MAGQSSDMGGATGGGRRKLVQTGSDDRAQDGLGRRDHVTLPGTGHEPQGTRNGNTEGFGRSPRVAVVEHGGGLELERQGEDRAFAATEAPFGRCPRDDGLRAAPVEPIAPSSRLSRLLVGRRKKGPSLSQSGF